MTTCVLAVVVGIAAAEVAGAETLRVPDEYSDIQSAIEAARSGDTIRVGPGTYEQSIDFLGKAVLVVAPDGATLRSDTVPIVRFENDEGRNSELRGFTLRGAIAPFEGGGAVVCSNASPTLRDNIFHSNRGYRGCAVFVSGAGARPRLHRNHFENNGASIEGAGIMVTGAAALEVDACTFVGNHSRLYGGSVVAYESGDVVFEGCRFEDTWAHNGGAVSVESASSLTLTDCRFERCSGRGYGGALRLFSTPDVTLTRTDFVDNHCDLVGGAIVTSRGVQAIYEQCRFTNNEAIIGGAVSAYDFAIFELRACSFVGNRANAADWGGYGSALELRMLGLSILDSVFASNVATGDEGGAIRLEGGTASLHNVEALANRCAGTGAGAYFATENAVTIRGGRWSENHADVAGGAIHATAPLTLRDALLDRNRAPAAAAVLLDSGGTLTHVTCAANQPIEPQRASIEIERGLLTIENSIVWNGPPGREHQVRATDLATVIVRTSLVRGRPASAQEPSEYPPGFVDAESGDFRLRLDSKWIDAGDPAVVLGNDFEGDPRPIDGDRDGTARPDLGADELDPAIACRTGTVGLANGSVRPVVLVNGSSGDTRRVVRLRPRDRVRVEVVAPEAGPAAANYAMYAFEEAPDVRTLSPQPWGVGTACFATPIDRRPTRHLLWSLHTLRRLHRHGGEPPRSKLAPCTLIDRPYAHGWPERVTIQGIIADTGSAATIQWSLTNAVILDVSEF